MKYKGKINDLLDYFILHNGIKYKQQIITIKMKKILYIIILTPVFSLFSQQSQDSIKIFKKRVLEEPEVDMLLSYYTQDGDNAAVTGGIGTENLQDYASNITIAIPLNENDVFTIDATVSAYTSASSSNLNPFTGASEDDDDDDDDDDRRRGADQGTGITEGTPWAASSGASGSDVWVSGVFGYSHSSDNRNRIWTANLSVSSEYDYFSFGFGGSHTWLFNKKNTELSFSGNIFLDTWKPAYPTEIISYNKNNGNLNLDFFEGIDILDQNGNIIDKNSISAWRPYNTDLIDNKSRNTFSGTLSFSQILSKKLQMSLFIDVVQQTGWLANPMQRVYFKDRPNFYVGNATSIPNYTNTNNTNVFQLADDIERLPDSRFKTPVGVRLNYYVSERIVLRSYYRFYNDNWGISSHTASLEIPLKIAEKFTIYPSYRYYTQTQANYFAPYEEHTILDNFYTSDFDLSAFNSNQYGFGIRYTDIFTKNHIWKIKLKQANLKYSNYQRNTGLHFNIVTIGFKFIYK